MYEAFLPRDSASAYDEMAALVHAKVNTIVSVIPNRAPPYTWHCSQLHKLKWGWGSSSHPTGAAAVRANNRLGTSVTSPKRRMGAGKHRAPTAKQQRHGAGTRSLKRRSTYPQSNLVDLPTTVLGERTTTLHRCNRGARQIRTRVQARTNLHTSVSGADCAHRHCTNGVPFRGRHQHHQLRLIIRCQDL